MAYGKKTFDRTLDKELFSETIEFETSRIKVGVYSYNEGEKKLQLSRETRDMDGQWTFAKLGRMFKDEVEAVIPVMQKALGNM
jgi:hypothetical protein